MLFFNEKTHIISIEKTDKEYPAEWLDLPDAPQTLYAVGNISLLKTKKFVAVGARRTPQTALKLGEKLAQTLSQSFTLVTGTADGGDMAVIEGALKGSGKIICLLAGGFSAVPQANLALLSKVAEKGLLLSPHSYETPVRSFSYEYRNKLLAKIGEGTLVLGAAQKSGALITAKYALQFKKPVFAIPYSPNVAAGEGCNALIKRGGYLTETAEDVLEKFGLKAQTEKRETLLNETEEKVYEALKEQNEAHVNELASLTQIPVFKLRAVLSALEIKGLVFSIGGNRYSVV